MAATGLLTVGVALLYLYPLVRARPVRHIVLISVDTLRADRLGCYGSDTVPTPHVDRLAREGVLFDNAATATPLTLPAHASLFTGRSPLRHGVIDNFGYRLDPKELTLAESLRAAGFATGGFIGSFVLDRRWGMGQGFDVYFDQFDATGDTRSALEASQRSGDQVLSRALEWIREQGERPFFAFIHFYDPHTPYAPPEPYRSRYGPTEAGYYDGEVAFVDQLVGDLLKALEERGLYDDALVILLADHGESLGDHGESTHGYFIYDETVRVPLLVKAPGVAAGGRARAQVRTIDVLPTILDLAGVSIPEGAEGTSLGPLLRAPDGDPGLVAYVESHYSRLHFGWAPLRGVRSERYKFIEAPERELYDLRADPRETKNLVKDRRGVAEQLTSTVARLVQAQAAERPREEPLPIADRETEQRLAALGYLTAGTSRSPRAGEILPDPKAKIGVFNRISDARIAAQIGEVDRAVALLDAVLREDPEVMLGYMLLGNIRLQRREFEEAAAVFRAALTRDGESNDGAYGLALAYKGLGRWDAAAAGFERCRQSPAHAIRATYQLAEVRLAQKKPREAESLLRTALAENADASLRLTLAEALLAQSRVEEALLTLREAESEHRENVAILLSLGNLLLERGDAEPALAAYARAESLAPRSAAVLNGKGNALARLSRAKEALAAFSKAVEIDPGLAPAQNNLGIALAQSGRGAEAERAFRLAIEADPGYSQAYNNLGFLYLGAGAVREAIPLFRRALALKPDYVQARSNLELALRKAEGR